MQTSLWGHIWNSFKLDFISQYFYYRLYIHYKLSLSVLSHVFGAVDKTSSGFSVHGKRGNFIIIIISTVSCQVLINEYYYYFLSITEAFFMILVLDYFQVHAYTISLKYHSWVHTQTYHQSLPAADHRNTLTPSQLKINVQHPKNSCVLHTGHVIRCSPGISACPYSHRLNTIVNTQIHEHTLASTLPQMCWITTKLQKWRTCWIWHTANIYTSCWEVSIQPIHHLWNHRKETFLTLCSIPFKCLVHIHLSCGTCSVAL